MGLFGLGKKDNFIDLTEKYKKQQKRAREIKGDSQEENISDSIKEAQPTSPGIFGMFGGTNQQTSVEEIPSEENIVEKKRKLAKRLIDMTNKIEDLSNQIYHLQQRVEILERRNRH